MASNKDILDAQRFNKRRLISAFTSGIPSGREVELKSPWGPLILGLVLTGLIMLGGWLFGRFAPSLPQNWESGTYVVDSDSGARYYSVDGVLHPMLNTASARLLQGSAVSSTVVGSDALDGIERGTPIGIPGAPDSMPGEGQLSAAGWMTCPVGEDLSVNTASNLPSSEGEGALVSYQDQLYLIAEGTRHAIPDDQEGTVRIAFNWESTEPIPVSAAWLDLFDQGSELAPLTVDHVGDELHGLPEAMAGATVGTVLEVPDADGSRHYVLTSEDTVQPLNPVQLQMYLTGGAVEASSTVRVSVADIARFDVGETGPGPEDWPTAVPTLPEASETACAVLSTSGDGDEGSTTPHTEVVAAPAPAEAGIEVPGGTGALVRATSGGEVGSLHLITDTGQAFGLEGDPGETISALGYTEEDLNTVPAAWVRLFDTGPSLSLEAAWATVPEAEATE
ncbi:type VII secretion protein EccB [Citricoccus sp. NR2]|uniref:type VII secretion protein EccB n=1 Tax=Citricoccus sp. NR2 TaxID=3004095 RepID=UPI0022DE30F4|nr:type VII secretion protein EccB [Citricoccus sp. NR2]WBL19682.1 type VII secretion protein EccB [Citricoccus sp. NR2]